MSTNFPWSFMLLLSSILCGANGRLETSGPSDEPIATNPADLAGGTIAVEFVPSSAFFQDFQPPYPTDVWWSGMTLGWQSNILAGPFPFMSRTENEGLGFGVAVAR